MKTSKINTANLHANPSAQVLNAWPEKAVYVKEKKTVLSAERFTFSILWEKHVQWFEESRFALMTMMITLQSCLGSIACMYIFQNHASDFQFILCTMVTMTANAMFIAQGPAKVCLASLYTSIFVNLTFILLNC